MIPKKKKKTLNVVFLIFFFSPSPSGARNVFPAAESLSNYYYYRDYYRYYCRCCTAKQPPEEAKNPHHPAKSTSDRLIPRQQQQLRHRAWCRRPREHRVCRKKKKVCVLVPTIGQVIHPLSIRDSYQVKAGVSFSPAQLIILAFLMSLSGMNELNPQPLCCEL